MLTVRAEELIRVTFSKEVYTTSTTNLRSQAEIDAIIVEMREPIDQLVEKYLSEMKAGGLTTPEQVKANGRRLREITSRMEEDLEEQLKSRLGRNDN
jgi:hypothetical protein